MNIDEIYKDLTQVDINEQEELWNERGKGYYGEYLVFKELYLDIPGCSKILMNLQIPGTKTAKTELDLVLIHETGLYVFEVKHYKGTIYGKDTDHTWTQYFRTVNNETFYNPILQNEGHIKALREMIPNAPVVSFVVFTNPEVDLRVENNNDSVIICRLDQMLSKLKSVINARTQYFNMELIDKFFQKLRPYSPIMEKNIEYNGETVPLDKYLETVKKDYSSKKEDLENNYNLKTAALESNYSSKKMMLEKDYQTKDKMIKKQSTIIIIVAAIILGVISFSAIQTFRHQKNEALKTAAEAIAERDAMAKNFSHVDDLGNGEFEFTDESLYVSDVALVESINLKDSAEIAFKIHVNNSNYGIKLTPSTKFIVIKKDGSSQEYNFFDIQSDWNTPNLAFYTAELSFGYGQQKVILSQASKEDISYVKLKDIDVCKYPFGSTVKSGLELELYDADKAN